MIDFTVHIHLLIGPIKQEQRQCFARSILCIMSSMAILTPLFLKAGIVYILILHWY